MHEHGLGAQRPATAIVALAAHGCAAVAPARNGTAAERGGNGDAGGCGSGEEEGGELAGVGAERGDRAKSETQGKTCRHRGDPGGTTARGPAGGGRRRMAVAIRAVGAVGGGGRDK